jgi:hypothetical protein
MPDMEYWKQRARDAEQKLLDLGHKGVDKAKDLTGKAKDNLSLGKDAARRGIDMGKAKAGINLDEPLLPQAGAAAKAPLDAAAPYVGKGIDAAGDAITKDVPALAGKAGSAIAGGAGDLKNMFLDKMLGTSGGQDPYMYQGSPPTPPTAPAPYVGDQTSAPSAPSMYGTGQEQVGQQPPPNAPSMYGTGTEPNPQPSMYGTGQEAQPYMYNNEPPSMMQRGGQVMNQGRHMMNNTPEHMERALKAAEDAYHRTLEHLRGGGQ